jgi:hypothetical protein
MDDVKRFLEESPLAARVRLPTHIIVQRLTLSPDAVGGIIERGSLAPGGQRICELEVGGQCLARGRIVRRRGRCYFKVIETDRGDAS